MTKQAIIIISFAFLFFSCQKKEIKVLILTSDTPEDVYFEIRNNGKKTALFSFINNEKNVLTLEGTNRLIDSLYPNIPEVERVWHFLTDYTEHKPLITPQAWLYNPILLINSGGSLCGFRSATMTNLLLERGIEARSWGINGHVITEVKQGDTWQLYDPDLGVVYYNKNGLLCSVEELSHYGEFRPDEIKIKCISNIRDSLYACSQELTDMYHSINDNSLFTTRYPDKSKKKEWLFSLPPGAVISFPLADTTSSEDLSLAVLTIPAGWTGNIDMLFIPFEHNIDAQINFGDFHPDGTHRSWLSCLAQCTDFDGKVELTSNPHGVVLTYYINPLIYKVENINQIQFHGKNIDGLQVKLQAYSTREKPTNNNYLNLEYQYWNTLLSQCHDFDNIAVNSFDGFMYKLRTMQECFEFVNSELDTLVVNQKIAEWASNFVPNNEISWKHYSTRDEFLWAWVDILHRINYVREQK